jgi:hypothetical protein
VDWFRHFVSVDESSVCRGRPSIDYRHRHLGRQYPGRMGLCDYQFRLVDWYRPCGDFDLGNLAAATAALAYVD